MRERYDWLNDEEWECTLRIVKAWMVVFDKYRLEQAKVVARLASTNDSERIILNPVFAGFGMLLYA